MNEQAPSAADASELQFDEAQYSAPTTAGVNCTACRAAITDQYFQINGAILCEGCSTAVKSQFTGGAGFPRFFKASLFGLAASFAGFLIYYGILKLTGFQIGLISILVGYMVGSAVRRGSGGRGGLLYQAIAVGCTYLAIAASQSALIVPELIAQIKKDNPAALQPQNAENPPNAPAVDTPMENAAAPAENAATETKNMAKVEPAEARNLTFFDVVFGLAVIFAFMLSVPFLIGFSSPMSLIIVAIALWEAFKLNAKMNLVITGPHNIGHNPDPDLAHV